MQTYYFEYFENAWSCPAVMIVSPCRHLWYPKCWNQLVGNFDVYLHAKKSTSSLASFFRYCKDIVNLLFWELWKGLTISIKIIVSICSKLSCLSACKKSTSSLNLDYFEEKLKFLIIFSKKSKKNYFRANLGPFCFNLVRNEFSWKRGICQFFNYFNYFKIIFQLSIIMSKIRKN